MGYRNWLESVEIDGKVYKLMGIWWEKVYKLMGNVKIDGNLMVYRNWLVRLKYKVI